jgi:1,2-diacylglycerol 3-alpha-glucosyltransferase
MTDKKKSNVFIVCSGLGNIQRGYESFTQECFEALSESLKLDITLFKGGGESTEQQIRLWNFPRNYPFTKQLITVFGKHPKFSNPYFLEQASFCLSLIPHILHQRPDVIFFSDFELGTMLWNWRRISKLSYKLLFSNGAPNGPPFSRMDCVQQLTPTYYQSAIDAGESTERHTLVPYGIKVKAEYSPLTQSQQEVLRSQLNLPLNRPIILSVAAIKKTHKRMDYLIREVARLPEPRPYLILLGQIDEESSEVIQLGCRLLGSDNFQVKTVTYDEINSYYRVADLFALASLNEGFGRVLLEAMSNGLPCLVHDYEVTRFVLKDQGYFADLTTIGSLSALIKEVLIQNSNDIKYQRHNFIYEHYSWDRLRPAYLEMIQLCAEGKSY